MNEEHAQYTSARATPDIVDRVEILQQIFSAIENPSKKTHVFYITAWGGWGKTRLTEEVLDRLKAKKGGSSNRPAVLAAEHAIDLYHMNTHSIDGLVAEIVGVLNPGDKYFKDYAEQRRRLERAKHDFTEELSEINYQRKRMLRDFMDDFNKLGRDYSKVVLVMDTAEMLVYEAKKVEAALGLGDKPHGVPGWIAQHFIPEIKGAVLLIAGRPENERLIEDLRKIDNIDLTEYQLQPFTEDETLQYFEAIRATAAKDTPSVAKQIDGIPEESRRVIHHLAGGQPFLLALVIDYLAVTEKLIDEVRMPLATAKANTATQKGREAVQEELKKAIAKHFQENLRPLDDVIHLLAWTPKGMGAEMLAWMIKGGRPDDAEIDRAAERLELLRRKELRLSFIKIRPSDHRVFLQDEMYALFWKSNERLPPPRIKKYYELINQYYNAKIEQTRHKIRELQEQHLEQTRLIVQSSYSQTLIQSQPPQLLTENEDLYKQRMLLQSLQVEQVYYALRLSFIKGFELYYRYAEEAFHNNNEELWLQLRDEVLRFVGQSDNLPQTFSNEIFIDIGIRWIKTDIVEGKYEQALQQIQRLRENCADLLPEGFFADLDLKIWEAWALTYLGRDLSQLKEALKETFKKAEDISTPESSDFDIWREQIMKANALHALGFLHRSLGNFKEAVRFYTQSLPLWREVKLETQHAVILNNLAWALAEVGDFSSALKHCQDGLRIRQRLGHRYAVALSMNTLGLIETRHGEPERARFRCEQALTIFRDIESQRGVGLASIALAEALRRMTNIPHLLPDKLVRDNLEVAEKYASEAINIFTDAVKEPLRLAEAYLELGCTYRELASRFEKDEIHPVWVEKSEESLRKSAAYAGKDFYYRQIDALVNLAWLYYYLGLPERAEHLLKIEILPEMDERYLIKRGVGVVQPDNPVGWFWVQIGKSNLLLGQIEFNRYQEANAKGNKKKAEEHLGRAAKIWALALAYDLRYSQSFRDMEHGLEIMYENLVILNATEMRLVQERIRKTYEDYCIPDELQRLGKYIEDRLGYGLEMSL